MFAHLNVHSVYSPMRGLLSLSRLVQRIQELNMEFLALTEVNGLWGFIRFVQQARGINLKPIAGANLITPSGELLLLVESQAGYANLCRILSDLHERDHLALEVWFSRWGEGLFVLSHQRQVLETLCQFVSNTHLFVELRPGVSEKQAHDLAREFHLEVVATGDVYFEKPSDHHLHKVLRAIAQNTTLSRLSPGSYKGNQHWLRSEREMQILFPNSLEAINNSYYLAERCYTDWSFVNTIFPDLSLRKTHRANRVLKKMVYQGARQRYGDLTPEIVRRIDYELSLIAQKGFAPYFLIVRDIVQQTRATIGRGSGAASIVSYCLFITQVDPIRYHLQFERFIHPERVTLPDIDIDFPWDERDDILAYVFQKYGQERTAMVATQVFLRPRSAIREVAKVYGLSNEEIKSLTKRIGYHHSRRDLLRWIREDPRFANVNLDDTLREVIACSEKITGVFRHASVHPGGVIIVPDEIRKYVPVLKATKGVQIVEWEKDQVEDAGLMKIDLLGNRSLAVVRDTLRQIKLNYGAGAVSQERVDYHRLQPVGDPKTEALLQSGKTMGIFYIESPATRLLLTKAGQVDFEHLVIYTSIIRPAANRFADRLVERIHGKPWKLIHPDLEFLKESYGIMVYEEQVSQAARVLAGFGYSEAEIFRKTMGREAFQHLLPGWKRRFYAGAQRRGYSRELIDTVWDMMASFVGYSFCKPHSASYAMLSLTCAYLKAHYPAEFLAAVVTNQGGYYSAYAYLSEARRMGIQVLLPDINRSEKGYWGRGKVIRMGFMSIKRLQEKAIQAILAERKRGFFASLDDFLLRVDLDLSDAIALTNAGCFRELEPGLAHREVAYRVAGFYLQEGEGHPFSEAPLKEEISPREKARLEVDTFGFPVSQHPLTPYREWLRGRVQQAREIPDYVGRRIRLAGVYITRKEAQTRRQEPMEFLTLEDETATFECVLFPDVFRKYGDLLHWESLFLVQGVVESAFGVCTVTVEKLGSLLRMMQKVTPVSTFQPSGKETLVFPVS